MLHFYRMDEAGDRNELFRNDCILRSTCHDGQAVVVGVMMRMIGGNFRSLRLLLFYGLRLSRSRADSVG